MREVHNWIKEFRLKKELGHTWLGWERNGNAVFHFRCFDTYPLPPFPPAPTVTVDSP